MTELRALVKENRAVVEENRAVVKENQALFEELRRKIEIIENKPPTPPPKDFLKRELEFVEDTAVANGWNREKVKAEMNKIQKQVTRWHIS